MTDEELIARLHLPWPKDESVDEVTVPLWVLELTAEAADRIEELIVENEQLEARLGERDLLWQAYDGDLHQAYVDANEARIDAEAKLAKAVELLEEIEVRLAPISGFFFDTFPRKEIKAILAEIK